MIRILDEGDRMYHDDTNRMAGPTNKVAALAWIQDAMASGRYVPAAHFGKRCQERGVGIMEVKRATARATRCEEYPGAVVSQGGTAWRVFGSTLSGDELGIGYEAFLDADGEQVVICTVFWR